MLDRHSHEEPDQLDETSPSFSGAQIGVYRGAIDAAVAQVFGLKPCQLKSATRGQAPAAQARQVAMYVTHISCGMNLTDVGALFARDRTTVSHACAVVEDRRDDPVFDRVLELLEWITRETMARAGHRSAELT